MGNKQLVYWIWLNQIKGIGPVISKKLLGSFKTPENIFKADIGQLQSIEGIGEKTAKIIVGDKDNYLSKAEAIINKCVSKNIKIFTIEDNLYPVEAKNIKDSPIILYYRGNIIENAIGVGIVGSRRCSEYGKKVVKEAASYLAENNIPVISGMAKGIDGYAHTACINAGGYTLAFLGCGVDICYPKEHASLMNKIIENGAVISEYPPGTRPDGKNFPKRNRLISAFSSKLLVVEASEQSGSLITAKFSKQYGRQVFAVPSSIYSKEGVGTNKLISNNDAQIYISKEQLIDKSHKVKAKNTNKKEVLYKLELDSLEKQILSVIKNSPKTFEEIKRNISETDVDILEKLSLMELEGKIENKHSLWVASSIVNVFQ